MSDLRHLNPEIWDLVAALPTERIEFIRRDVWLGYTAATSILDDWEELIQYPRNVRMPCRMMIGDADNGKSMLLKHCARLHPPVHDANDAIGVPVVVFETPPEPDEGRLYSEILTAMLVSHREDAAPERLKSQVVDRLAALGTRLLLGDEIHNLLQGSIRDQKQCLASLKSLLNTLRISFVAAGTEDVSRALATDPQFFTRFQRQELPTWGRNEQLRRLLVSMERILPFAEPSNLSGIEIASAVAANCGGTIGTIRKIMIEAGVGAVKAKEDCITLPRVMTAIAASAAGRLAA